MDFTQLPAILTPDIGLLFWMLLAFLVVFCALAKFGFPVITKTVEERKNFIDESLRKAHEANERLENIQVEGEKILQSAREKQSQILREGAETRDNIVEKGSANRSCRECTTAGRRAPRDCCRAQQCGEGDSRTGGRPLCEDRRESAPPTGSNWAISKWR